MCDCEQIQRLTGLWYSAEYSTFSISDEADNYTLTVAGYSGDAGNAMAAAGSVWITSNGLPFSTPDSDNDVWSGNCADNEGSGWWFGECSVSHVNKDTNAIWQEDPNGIWNVQASRMLVKLN